MKIEKIHRTHYSISARTLVTVLFLLSFFGIAFSNTPTTHSLSLVKYYDPMERDASGDNQIGTVNEKLSQPIMLVVENEEEQPVAGVQIDYMVLYHPSDIKFPPEVVAENEGRTDRNGIYRASCRLGDKPGEYEILFFIPRAFTDIKSSSVSLTFTAYKHNWGNWLILGLLGGLALFLYGMEVTADGLQSSSGVRMRGIIQDMTRKPLLGMGVGTLITFMMQSSSAVTTMLVSLVSARLMTLRQALVIIPGAAIGTTITVQLISFNILDYSLPMIALGFFIYAVSHERRKRAIGSVILGFGMIFFGMKIMTESIDPLRGFGFFIDAMEALSRHPFMAMVFSALFTALIQSSGATLGIVIALAYQGSISLEGAIPIIFGANIGTCITAILASLGASREAKRVAWAHLAYKLIGVILFYPFIPYLALGVQKLSTLLSFLPMGLAEPSPPRLVANTHTLYNLIIAFGLLPLLPQFEQLIRRIMPPKAGEARVVRTKYLDLQILESPSIAIGSVLREMSRMARFVQEQMKAIGEVLFERKESQIDFIHKRDDKIDQLQISITRYLANLTQKRLSPDELDKSIGLLSIVNDLENIGDIIDKNLIPLGTKIIQNTLRFSPEGEKELKELYQHVMEDLSRVVIASSSWQEKPALEVIEHKEMLKNMRQELMLKHLSRMQEELKETIETSSVHMDIINYLLRLEFYSYRIARVVAGQITIQQKEEILERTTNHQQDIDE